MRTKKKDAAMVTLIGLSFGLATAGLIAQSQSSSKFQQRIQNFHPSTTAQAESSPSIIASATEAPTGFDNVTNGFIDQATFDSDKAVFEKVETIQDGLGPTYNAQSCRECHQNVVTGGASQVAEQRAGHVASGVFYNSLGGSLIESRATNPEIVEHTAAQDEVRTFRISTNILGAGFVEAIADGTLLSIRDSQPEAMRGTALVVPILEANEQSRIGRFGWKSQHGSLQSFAADAYVNEMGITNPLFPDENTSGGRYVGYGTSYDPVPEPEDNGADITAFSAFMRSTKAPSRGPITPDVQSGDAIFNKIGCSVCHVSTIATANTGTKINGGTLTVSAALGNKVIHPYSDFLLHNIGSGDGIPFLPTAEFASTANQIRTAPLWALRTRNRLMHDGLSLTKEDAIRRHSGQAYTVRQRFNALTPAQKTSLMAFLDSL
ncbi:MAG: hypothetical protein JWO20_180 [Candidatus Angelobacter sp.]|nr:hypothetical protein [Candidatus Angelobacter sp.]